MSGHSKWANIKHKKAAADAKKGKVFSKLAREITISVRQNGGDPSSNLGLRTLLQKARGVNMPADNIDRAIKKGTGELQGERLEEIMFEGFFPGGVAIVVQALTDNRNRTVAEIRHIFTKFSASLAGQGQVLRSFPRRGYILVDQSAAAEDRLMELILEAGAEDMKQEEERYEIITDPSQFNAVVEALSKAEIKTESAELTLLPESWAPVSDKEKASSLVRFIEELEELDDVQNVYSNADIDESVMKELEG
jgi:YebC/PmpR family DNA-binding regulatory protein